MNDSFNSLPAPLGEYILLSKIASGGMAEVYCGISSRVGHMRKLFGIKVLRPAFCEEHEYVELFKREAQLCSRLNHPNIVHMYDCTQDKQNIFLVMEFVRGKTLRQIHARCVELKQTLPAELACYFTAQICHALDYAHRLKDEITGIPLKMVHRDISPQNIMLSYDGNIKVVDFGIAKAKETTFQTHTGVIRGKVSYLSPEQAHGEQVDERSDLFSTGLVLYELLTGVRPFYSTDPLECIRLAKQCCLVPPNQINPMIPAALSSIVERVTAKDMSDRFQSAREFKKALDGFLSQWAPHVATETARLFMESLFRSEILEEAWKLEQSFSEALPLFLELPKQTQKKALFSHNTQRYSQRGHRKQSDRLYFMVSIILMLTGFALIGGIFISLYSQKMASTLMKTAAQAISLMKIPDPMVSQPVRIPTAGITNSPAQPAILESIFSRDCKLYIDGKYWGAVKAGRKIQISLPGEKTYQLRMVNEKLGVDLREAVTLMAGSTTNRKFILKLKR